MQQISGLRKYFKYAVPSRAYELLTQSARARYLTASWSLGIVVLGFLILSGQGLFTVLMPGAYYPWPVQDRRTPVTLTGFDRVTGKETSTRRLILPSADSVVFARRIAYLINEPALIQDKNLDTEFRDLDNQAELAFSVKKIWLKGNAELLIDIRESTMLEEVRKFAESRGEPAAKEPEYLDRYFYALTRSVLENDSQVQSVRFFIDGVSKDIPGMNFKLSKEHTRSAAE